MVVPRGAELRGPAGRQRVVWVETLNNFSASVGRRVGFVIYCTPIEAEIHESHDPVDPMTGKLHVFAIL